MPSSSESTAFDGWVDAPPPGRGGASKAPEWEPRFTEARKHPGKWGMIEFDTGKEAAAAAASGRRHSASAPGGAEAYTVTSRSMPDGTGALYIRFRPVNAARAKLS